MLRTAVEILVSAPRGEVGVPLVQLQDQVAGRMRQVKPHHATVRMPRASHSRQIERTAGRVIDTAHQYQRD